MNTQGSGGKKVAKDAKVYTNDPHRKVFSLILLGQIHHVAEVLPRTLRLSGTPMEEIKAETTITPMPDFPFKIVSTHARNDGDFQFDLKKRKHQYVLSVYNTKKTAGRYWGQVFLKTDLKGGPAVTVTVQGNIYHKPVKKIEKP